MPITGRIDRQDFAYLTGRIFCLFDQQDFLPFLVRFFAYLKGRIFLLYDQQDFLSILAGIFVYLKGRIFLAF